MTNQITKTQSKTPATIKERLQGEEFKMAVAQALPKHLTPDRFIRIALTAITRTPKLANCDQPSFFSALLTLSQLGLEPDGRRAHLIPFENRKRGCTEVQLIVDYKGLVELAMNTGLVSNIHADVVCDNDEFEYDIGEIKQHRVNFKQPRGNPYAAYALVRFKDGTTKCEVMTMDEIERIRSRSRAGNSGPWCDHFSEMCKKTAFRRLTKWIRLSPELSTAMEKDYDAPVTVAELPKQSASVIDVGSFIQSDADPEQDQSFSDDDQIPGAEIPQTPPQQAATAPKVESTPKPTESVQSQLQDIVESRGMNLGTFNAWAHAGGHIKASVQSWDKVPDELCNLCIKAKTGMLNGMERFK